MRREVKPPEVLRERREVTGAPRGRGRACGVVSRFLGLELALEHHGVAC